MIAAQSIGEPGTQLTMRTFHIGGAAQRGAEQSSVEASVDGAVTIKNRNVVTSTPRVCPVVMGRNLEIVLDGRQGRERARHRVPYGAKLLVDDGANGDQGPEAGRVGPLHHCPIITEKEGIANYMDLIEGVSMREILDETTGISNRVVVDWKQQPKGSELKPRITLRDDEGRGDHAGQRHGGPLLHVGGRDPLGRQRRAHVKAGDVLARIPRENLQDPRHHRRSAAGGRAVRSAQAQGLRHHQRDRPGRVEFGKDYKNQAPDRRGARGGRGSRAEYLIPKGKHISVQEGDYVEAAMR